MSDCPWDEWAPATVRFCEASVCCFIDHPANTWSNLAYFIAGVFVARLALREGRPRLALIGVIEVLVGIGSFFFHASGTYAGEVVDIGAMFLFSAFAIVMNASRLRPSTRSGRTGRLEAQAVIFGVVVCLSVVAMLMIPGSGVIIFVLHVIAAGALEVRILRRRHEGISYRPLLMLCLFFAAAWTSWWLDILGVVCDPDDHVLQGHAAWHVINSCCFYFLYRFYAQLPRSISAG